MPRLINLYILKEIAVPFGLTLVILTATALLSKVLTLVELLISHGIGPSFAFWFIASAIPSFLIYTIPFSFLVAVLIAIARLSSDSELTAMKASGVSLYSILKPVAVMATCIYVIGVVVMLYLYPWGNLKMKSLVAGAAESNITAGIEEKRFYDRFSGLVLYVDRLKPETGELAGVFISESDKEGKSSTFFSDKGRFVTSEDGNTLYLKLEDGTLHSFNPTGPKGSAGGAYHLADFTSYLLELTIPEGEPLNIWSKTNRELYPGELLEKIESIRAKGEPTAPYVIDFHKRFALPFSVFIFALLGLPLGMQKIRSARFTGFSTALGVILVYYVLSTAFEALGENGNIPPLVSVWGSDVLLGVLGLWLFHRTATDRPSNLLAGLYRAVTLMTPHKGRHNKGRHKKKNGGHR
ncbi:MAG: LPS export ABC transporter permease LptF [Proteobacteria bacterium]|nr:LPS export ABC transporter permease LptF [Pseudomonadota bacterium]